MISGKVLKSEIDENGNIKVETEYTLTDGSKKIGNTRYNFKNFSKEKVLEDVKTHCETLMTRVYSLKAHQELVKVKVSDIKYDCVSAVVIIEPEKKDKDGNIIAKQTITIDDK